MQSRLCAFILYFTLICSQLHAMPKPRETVSFSLSPLAALGPTFGFADLAVSAFRVVNDPARTQDPLRHLTIPLLRSLALGIGSVALATVDLAIRGDGKVHQHIYPSRNEISQGFSKIDGIQASLDTLAGPTTDYSVAHFLSNEASISSTMNTLATLPQTGDTLIGVGGLLLLDMLVARPHIRHLFVFDLSSKLIDFWRVVLNIIEENSDPVLARAAIVKHIEKENVAPAMLFHLRSYLQSFLWSSWLQPENYKHVREELVLKKRIYLKQIDLSSIDQFAPVVQLLCESNTTAVDTLYLSNIYSYLPTGKANAFESNIDRLLESCARDSHVIISR